MPDTGVVPTLGSDGSLPPKSSLNNSMPSIQSSSTGSTGGSHSFTLSRKGSLIARQFSLSMFSALETATLYHPESAFWIVLKVRISPLKPDISDHVTLSVECHHLYSKGSANVPSLVKLAVRVVAVFSHTSGSPSIVTGGAQRWISISSNAKSLPDPLRSTSL